jgi:hypothetical protein
MFKRVVIVVILIFPLLAFAADWQVVADTKLGQLRLDKASVVKADKLTRAVLIYEFKDSQKVTKPPYDVFNRREDELLVDCMQLSLGVAARRFFEGEKLVSSFALKESDIKFSPSVPDTMSETVVVAVCAAALDKKL